MATIVNNPPAQDNSGGPFGLILGLVVLIVVVYLFFVYGIPALRNVHLGGTQVNVPSSIDVNVKQTK